VDADRLDSEAFEDPGKPQLRAGFGTIDQLRACLDAYIDSKISCLGESLAASPVNSARREVLLACRQAAERPQGIFSLTVPTGGGKTLSAMSLALRHAAAHDLRRVIVVIPYTSIIEQNAAVYREALGAENVVEHHSAYVPERAGAVEDTAKRHDLATENWDAPVIVTTSVQFFETLFSNRPSVCRKLHNVARSAIILDEVQTLPPGLLHCIVEALDELVTNYGCSTVLSTATPPALASRPGFQVGLKNVQPVISDPARLARDLRRVHYTWAAGQHEGTTWPQLARELAGYRQVLAIVHRRRDAGDLARELQNLSPTNTVHHLSALMCPAHRLATIRTIKDRLHYGVDCRVVSTQLVEAGVDLDFPVVYRALGGLSSVVQAAGRCNREGRLEEGEVVVFRAPTLPPPGTPRKAAEITEAMLQGSDSLDLDDPAVIEGFFRRLYLTEDLDIHGIQPQRQEINFATVGQRFRLIEDGFTTSVIVPYEKASDYLQQLRRDGPSRDLLRSLQPHMVSIYPEAFRSLNDRGALLEDTEGIYSVAPGYEHLYDATFGLACGDEPGNGTEALII